MSRLKEYNGSFDDLVSEEMHSYIEDFAEEIFDYLYENRDDKENGFSAFDSFADYFSNAREKLKEAIIENTCVYSRVSDFQDTCVYEMMARAVDDLNIDFNDIFTHACEDDDYDWFDKILREYFYEDAFNKNFDDLESEFHSYKEEE